MRRMFLPVLITGMLFTGCAVNKDTVKPSSAEEGFLVSDSAGAVMSDTEAVSLNTSVSLNTASSGPVIIKAGAASAESDGTGSVSGTLRMLPNNTEDSLSSVTPSGDTADDITPEAEPSAESTDEAAVSDDDAGSIPGSNAGIFTSSELTDEIKERITGISYPPGCGISYDDLRYLQLSYVDFNGETRTGEMICNKAVAPDLIQIFSELYHAGYQIEKIKLIDDYGGDDDLSCADNNTSCFNYRVVAGSTNLSKHALGVAVDLNPFYNPYVTYPDGKIRISPAGAEAYADRSADFPHKIDENDLAYKLFTSHGFTWGGHWKTLKDYQHFQKPL